MRRKGKGVTKNKPGRKSGESLTSRRRIEAKKKAAQAVALRIGGATYQAIADALGYNSPQASWDAVQRSLIETLREPSDELRTLELERLDSLFLSTYPLAKRGVLGAVDRCLRIMERRSRLLGLDAPERIDVSWREEFARLGIPANESVRMFGEMIQHFYDKIAEAKRE